MRGELTFTMKEMTRYDVIQSLLEEKMINREAALALSLSVRQVQRLKRKVEPLACELRGRHSLIAKGMAFSRCSKTRKFFY